MNKQTKLTEEQKQEILKNTSVSKKSNLVIVETLDLLLMEVVSRGLLPEAEEKIKKYFSLEKEV